MEFTGSGRPSLTGSGQPALVRCSVPVIRCKVTEYTGSVRAGITGSGRTSLTGSSQPDSVRWSVPVVQSKAPAEYTEPGRAGVIGSGQPRSENKLAASVLSKEMHSTESMDKRTGVDSERSLVVSNGTVTGALAAPTNHVATFLLAFDEFLDSESESWEDDATCQAAEYTEIKPLRERVLENAHTDSPEVLSSSQRVGLYRSGETGLTGSVQHHRSLPPVHCRTATSTTSRLCGRISPSADCISRSGQASLIRSGHPAPVTPVMSKPVTSSTDSSYSPTASQSVSGHFRLTGSQQAGITGSGQSAAARSREERIRLSRLKKEEFQRKLAANSLSTNQLSASQLSTNQLSTSSPSVDTTSAGVITGDSQRKLCILVDSRELSGAQVNSVVNWA